MSQTFTPGPWQLRDEETPEGRLTIIANVDGEYFTDSPAPRMSYDFIATCEDEYGEHTDEAFANARLIAAAPDLYEALIGLNRALDAYWNIGPKARTTGGTIKAIEAAQQASAAALAKAEGRS